mmetsp:Transcript_4614/g.7358  ORF Transcript_4614/g.7358 Transcript_4614/m.7358 type:complete len:166 (-) Transcript_4614:116-613(-)
MVVLRPCQIVIRLITVASRRYGEAACAMWTQLMIHFPSNEMTKNVARAFLHSEVARSLKMVVQQAYHFATQTTIAVLLRCGKDTRATLILLTIHLPSNEVIRSAVLTSDVDIGNVTQLGGVHGGFGRRFRSPTIYRNFSRLSSSTDESCSPRSSEAGAMIKISPK